MSDRGLVRLAKVFFWTDVMAFALGLALSLVLPVQPPGAPDVAPVDYVLMPAILVFPLVGYFIATRQPRNALGWVVLAIGAVWCFTGVGYNSVTNAYAAFVFRVEPGSLPGGDLVLVVQGLSWIPAIGLMGTFLILLFPDGHLPSRRWRFVAWFAAAAMILAFLALAVTPGDFEYLGYPNVENPFGIESLAGGSNEMGPLQAVILMQIPIAIVLCAAGLIVRFRRSRGIERQQMKWFASAAGIVAFLYFAMMVGGLPWLNTPEDEAPLLLEILENVAVLSFILIPIAMGIAILKYRLYDIDVIINRALVYALLTGLLAVTYFAIVAGASTFAPDSNLAVAAATLAVAGLFQPARRRLQDFIDRRFYRQKYDAVQTVEAFSARLRDEVDLEALRADLVGVVGETMQPSHVSIWLRRGDMP